MGEVYRARDTKLGREVALKILPESFTHDPERVARFRREAQVLAWLNHPHIAQIHVLDEASGMTTTMHREPIPEMIRGLSQPDPALWKYYIIRAILTGPGIVASLPYLYFRYHTLRYRFDEEGIHMKVGILFRREINLTYARIQDIHLRSGLIQRWLGLADVQHPAAAIDVADLQVQHLRQAQAAGVGRPHQQRDAKLQGGCAQHDGEDRFPPLSYAVH